MTEDPTILTVGSEMNKVADYSKWDEHYNIKGYENVILDFYSLAERLKDEDIDGEIHRPSNSAVMRALSAGNRIFILLSETNRLNYGSRILHLDKLVPGNFSLIEESGKYVDLESVASGWEWYFDGHFDWNLRLGIGPKHFEFNEREFVLEYYPLVQNKSEEPVAFAFTYAPIIKSHTRTEVGEYFDGEVIFLPVTNRVTASELIENLIEYEIGVSITMDHKKSPKWTSDWSLPGEDKARTQVNELEDEIAKMNKKLDSLEAELAEYQRYKTLLWGNEKPLEQLVPEVFDEMGFDVEGEDPHGADGKIHLEDRSFVLEITGTTNDISDDKYEQLLGHVADAEAEDLKTRFDGLLVVNPRREEKPSERNPDEYLPTHLRRRIKSKGFKVLLTPTLYEMLERYRAGSIDAEDVREALLSADLVVEL